MTDDDLDLPARLRARADALRVSPDLTDVQRRSAEGHRRRTRAAGAALALVAVLGTVGGFALGRSTREPEKTFVATGQALGGSGDSSSESDSGTDHSTDLLDQLSGTDVMLPLAVVSDRTTEEGIRLVTRAAAPGDSTTAGCVEARTVRVGVAADDQLIGVVTRPIVAPVGDFVGGIGVTGMVEDHPVWVVMVASTGEGVTATFPNGTVDHAVPTDGIATLAAFADTGRPVAAYLEDSVQVTGASDGPLTVSFGKDPCAAAQTEPPPGPGETPTEDTKPPLPAPGEQPANAETAEQQVRTAFTSGFDQNATPEEKAAYRERAAVWLDANRRFLDSQYGSIVAGLTAAVDEVVFTAPDHASVRFQLLSDDSRVPRYQIGEAVLEDGTWKVSIKTSCDLLALASIMCDYDL